MKEKKRKERKGKEIKEKERKKRKEKKRIEKERKRILISKDVSNISNCQNRLR